MIASVRAELRRLGRWPTVWVLCGTWLLLNLAFGYLFRYLTYRSNDGTGFRGRSPAAQLLAERMPAHVPITLVQGLPIFGGALLLILGAVAVGSGYGWGTWKSVFTAGPRRVTAFGGTMVTVAIVVLASRYPRQVHDVAVVDAVVFDLDGVIVDSEPVWEDVRRGYVFGSGGRWRPDAQQRLMGMSTTEWAEYLSGELGVPRPPQRVAEDVLAEMVSRYRAGVPLIAGADRVVRELAQRWPLGLASSSPPELIAAALHAAGLTDTFAVTLSTEQVRRGKPAPDVYVAVADRLGVDATRCVAIEDSSNGIRAAAAAGMRVVAVPRPRYAVDDDARALAALVVGDITAVTPRVVRSVGGDSHR